MLKNKFITMFKLPSPELITRFSSLCLSLALMLSVFLGSPVHAQADVTASNFDRAILSVRATENGAIFSNLIADAAVEPEEAVETPEAKAAAKAEAKKAKAAAKLEAKKLKEAEDAKAEEVKAAAKAAKKAAKLEAKKAKEAAKLEAKKAKEAEKAAAAEAVEEKEKAETESAAPETATEPELESSPAEVVTP
jgi:septal ring factor EnvC (AmiA/AmiB activator)